MAKMVNTDGTPVKAVSKKYKDRLHDELAYLGTSRLVPRPDSKHNVGSYLGEIFTWQEVGKLADEKLKKAWKAAVEDDLIPSDEAMREKYDQDEHIVAESNAFSMIVTVGKPRETFDLEAFVSEVSRKWKINAVVLTKLAAGCKKSGTAPLTKRIREV